MKSLALDLEEAGFNVTLVLTKGSTIPNELKDSTISFVYLPGVSK